MSVAFVCVCGVVFPGILPQSVVVVAVQEVVATPVVTEGMDHPWTDMEVQIATAVLIGDILVIEAMVTGNQTSSFCHQAGLSIE